MRFPFSGKEEEKCTIEIREAVESREGYSFVAAGILRIFCGIIIIHTIVVVSCQGHVWSSQISGVLS